MSEVAGTSAGSAGDASAREVIAICPLTTYPGYWLLKGRTVGEFGEWYVVRAPKGTYWTAVIQGQSEVEPQVVEIRDKIRDSRTLAQCEAGFKKLWEGDPGSRQRA